MACRDGNGFSKRFHEGAARLRILAKERKMTVTQLISFILHEELDRIQLKEEDYEWIKEQVQKNERKRRNG